MPESAQQLAEDLRAWAADGAAPVRAAVDLLIKEGWLHRGDFVRAAVVWDGPQPWIRWLQAREFHDAAPRGSTTELAILDLAVTLADDRFRLSNMGRAHRQWIADAVAQAVGLGGGGPG
jgi:hypothetical protein